MDRAKLEDVLTKTSLMLDLGESDSEIKEALDDLRAAFSKWSRGRW